MFFRAAFGVQLGRFGGGSEVQLRSCEVGVDVLIWC